MAQLGYISLWLSLVISLYIVIGGFCAGKTGHKRLLASITNAVVMTALNISISIASLEFLLLVHDFSIKYVAQYTNRRMPVFYTASALWGGQAGSLLLWVWLISVFAVLVHKQNRHRNQEFIAYVYAVMFSVVGFFIFLLLFIDNPFALLPNTPPDGNGLNPLLQNPFMVFHPPLLYIGFVGFTVPFAFGISSLMKRKLDDDWIRTTRRWTIFSWLSLTIGVVLGAQWAYVELGWGGYWAWDPVENASILPWLVATAYLHSIMIQEKKSMLKIWNIVLIVATFILTIFGTFLTRSGVITSVHSFAESSIGYFFLGFMVVMTLWVVYLIITRMDCLRSRHEIESFFSREAAFLLNNIVLLAITFTIIWGTIFPVLSEAVTGTKITVGPPFFNKVTFPMWMILLFLTGIGPILAWRKTSLKNFVRNFSIPVGLSVLSGVLAFLLLSHQVYVILTITFSVFVFLTVFIEFKKGATVISRNRDVSFIKGLVYLVLKNRRRYGGYIVHIGVVLIYLGISGSAFKKEVTKTLYPYQSLDIQSYRLRYDKFEIKKGLNMDEAKAHTTLFKNGKEIARLSPSKEFHHTFEQPTTEVAIRSTLIQDIYLFIAGYDGSSSAVTFTMMVYPLVIWNWIGAIIILVGGVVAIFPARGIKPGRETVGSTI